MDTPLLQTCAGRTFAQFTICNDDGKKIRCMIWAERIIAQYQDSIIIYRVCMQIQL